MRLRRDAGDEGMVIRAGEIGGIAKDIHRHRQPHHAGIVFGVFIFINIGAHPDAFVQRLLGSERRRRQRAEAISLDEQKAQDAADRQLRKRQRRSEVLANHTQEEEIDGSQDREA